MTKHKTKKQRMSGIVDNSSMGLAMSTDMDITRASYIGLRKALNNFIKSSDNEVGIKVDLVNGHRVEGNATYTIKFRDKTNHSGCITYEFKNRGSNYFLNVTCNPTVIVAGRNDLPIIIHEDKAVKKANKPVEVSGKSNSAITTLWYAGRVAYLILEDLLDFEWHSLDRERIQKGDISIHRYQIAWYSNDLGDKRDALMLFLRAIYCGTDATSDYVKDVLGSLGIHGRAWQNSDGNLTIEVLVGKNKYISITLYAKDLDPKCAAIDTDRVQNLIRWDCTLFRAFLNNNKILKLKDFEKKYVELCEKDKYDIGFIRYLANLIQDKLYMKYLINLQVESYKDAVKALNGVKSKRKTTIKKKVGKDEVEVEIAVEEEIVKHWVSYGKSFNTKREFAEHIGISDSTINDALCRIKDKTGLNLEIPRSTHEAVLFNRENATLSMVERGERLLDIKGVSNSAIKRIESVKRDKDNSETFSKLLQNTSMENPFKIRRFTPKSFTRKTFYILNPASYYEKGTNKEPKTGE